MSFLPQYSNQLAQQAATTDAGVAMVASGTQTLATWTVPNDGNQHVAQLIASVQITTAGTGGTVIGLVTPPGGGSAAQPQLLAASQTQGNHIGAASAIVEPGSTVTIEQSVALTAGGVGTAWAAILGY
jgi:hypothetical protein